MVEDLGVRISDVLFWVWSEGLTDAMATEEAARERACAW